MLRLTVVVLGLCFTARAHAASVAVMPFRDLSGGKGSIGEAIRETVTTDLKEVGGLQVIERAAIDKVIAEQNLQAKKNDLDTIGSVRVGTLVGATLIVAGAYQKAANTLRLTARFVKVETGEIIGTAKIDGAQSEFLKLQDRVTSELLKSAGMEAAKVQRVAARVRPKVRSLRSIELYGDAVVEPSDEKRRALLQEALKIDPAFTYASRDLDALEQRMHGYAKAATHAQDQAVKDQLAQIDRELAGENNPDKIYAYYARLVGTLRAAGRPRTLIAVGKRVLEHPPAMNPSTQPALVELAGTWIFGAYGQLMDDDGTLREGEKLLAKYPGSTWFTATKMQMDMAITRKRKREEGVATAAKELAHLSPKDRASPCRLALLYASHEQERQSKQYASACAGDGSLPLRARVDAYELWFRACWGLGEFTEARKAVDAMASLDATRARSWKTMSESFPREE